MVFGIICEYNPFHNGHLRQINEIKRTSDAPIICVMSGSFTQRGEAAVTDKYTRARMALECGADVVLELPAPYCFASAESFSSAGVSILASVGVDTLCFGSESADADRLWRIAHVARSGEFLVKCRELPSDQPSTGGYLALLSQESGEGELSSNDILGVEYCKAILGLSLDGKMNIMPIKRDGSGYLDKTLVSGQCPSATAIREHILHGELADIADFVPREVMDILENAEISSLDNASDAILLALRLYDVNTDPVAIRDVGLINRLKSTARSAISRQDLLRTVGTKKYTLAAVNRAILCLTLGISQSDLSAPPAYTTLLGANAKGREYLASIRGRETQIPVITKPADAHSLRSDAADRQIDLSERADALYTLCFEKNKNSGTYFRVPPIMI